MKMQTVLVMMSVTLIGCSVVEADLSGRQCNSALECVEGYTCDPVTNLCVRTNWSCDDPGRIISCNPDPQDPTVDCATDSCRSCNDTGWSDCVFNPCSENNPCGNNGTCEPSNGSCRCDEGYAGLACDTCDTGFHPVGATCVSDDVCAPNDPTSASCDEHGTCTTPAGVVECSCDVGYAGLACDTCDPGYHREGSDCVLDQNCNPDGPNSASCNGHGTCDDSTMVIQCACNTGYTGTTCTQCDTGNGFHLSSDGVTCTDDPCDPNECTDPNKTVCLESGGVAFCQCDTGYHLEGNLCVLDQNCNPDGPNSASCNGNGTCSDGTGVIQCACNTGYDGITCALCDTGYHFGSDGVTCTTDPCDPNQCTDANKTMCTDSGGGNFTCACDPGYRPVGASCVLEDVCAPNDPTSASCNEHGICTTPAGVIECACDTGYDGTTCGQCDSPDHFGFPNCQLDQCFATGQTCSGNGTCDQVDGSCTCLGNQDPASGIDCGLCLAGYIEYPLCRDDPCDPDPCSGNGTCDNSGPTAVCTCLAGWSGAACDVEPFTITQETGAAFLADNPTLQNGPADCNPLYFRVTANRDISFGIFSIGVSCDGVGRVVDVQNNGHLYRYNGASYSILTLFGAGDNREVAIYDVSPAGDQATFAFTTEEVILAGGFRVYRYSPVMESLVSGEICTFTVLGAGDAAGSGYLYNTGDLAGSILSTADMCIDPLDLVFSDFSDVVHLVDGTTYPTVDLATCAVQTAGTQDWHTGSGQMISASIVLPVP